MNWNVSHLFSVRMECQMMPMNWMGAMRTKAPSFSLGKILIYLHQLPFQASRLNQGIWGTQKIFRSPNSKLQAALFISFAEPEKSSDWIECHLLVSNGNNRVRCLYWQRTLIFFSTQQMSSTVETTRKSFIFGLYTKTKHKQFSFKIVQHQFLKVNQNWKLLQNSIENCMWMFYYCK